MNRIKELRKAKNLTQKQLATHLQISNSTLSYWERGDFEPDNKSLIKLADFFEVSADYLLGRTDIKKSPDTSKEISDEDLRFALWGAQGGKVSDSAFKDVKRYAQFIAERELAEEEE